MHRHIVKVDILSFLYVVKSLTIFMSRLRLDVGQIVHTFSQHLLKLSSSCSIQLSHALGSGDTLTIPLRAEQLKSSGWWIARGEGLRLAIDLALDGITVDDFDRQKFIEELGIILKDAEVLYCSQCTFS